VQPNEATILAKGLDSLEPGAAFRAGVSLLNDDYPELLLTPSERLSELHPTDPRMFQLLGLAARAAGKGPSAFSAFGHAVRLAPTDPLIAHSFARSALDAGKPAVALFERASRLAPQDGSVLVGLAAALVAAGRGDSAIKQLDALLVRNPSWIEGHRSLAHIRTQLGFDPLASIEAALQAQPAQPQLHHLRTATLLEACRPEDAVAATMNSRAALGDLAWLAQLEAHALSESGSLHDADAAFAAAPPPRSLEELALLGRHHLRAGRAAEVATLLAPHADANGNGILWPYLSLAWRLLDDERSQWLEGDQSLVGVYDLADRIGNLDALADHLRNLHFAVDAPLDQSVRGGTQTDGNLLMRDEEPILRLRKLLLETVNTHIERLAPHRDGHPTLPSQRSPQRVAGAWSVRLRDGGFHVDHVHPQGWLSSAFYVAVPQAAALGKGGPTVPGDDSDHAGWLSLGESRELVPGLSPLRLIEPRPGRLVLFPSTMWHGTRPFPSGERLTVAFDIALPRRKVDR
jgi:tetratricopeptide (TPR) repeat protein